MLAARGRGAAAVAAPVRGALRGEHPDADHAPLSPGCEPGASWLFVFAFSFFLFLQPRRRGCDNEGKRGAWGGSSFGLLGSRLQVVGAHLKLAESGSRSYPIDSPLLGPGTRIFLWVIVEISARDGIDARWNVAVFLNSR